MRQPILSIIIPNHNGGTTIGRCLAAACAHRDEGTEVIVVDDGSTDDSTEIIGRFPCTLLRFDRQTGAGAARNAGAQQAKGEYLFFIDADCILLDGTLAAVRKAISIYADAVLGGTYTLLPADDDFFSTFQSVFIHFHETCSPIPDYVASHAMVIRVDTFRSSGGFPEQFLPIIEDVEFCHRLRGAGYRLIMDADIQVRHIFGFTFRRSLRNAFRKSLHWTRYSLQHGDIFADSGTASRGLKVNVLAFIAACLFAISAAATGSAVVSAGIAVSLAAALAANHGLVRAFGSTGRPRFALIAILYYFFVYPAAVAAGAASGAAQYAAAPRIPGPERAQP